MSVKIFSPFANLMHDNLPIESMGNICKLKKTILGSSQLNSNSKKGGKKWRAPGVTVTTATSADIRYLLALK